MVMKEEEQEEEEGDNDFLATKHSKLDRPKCLEGKVAYSFLLNLM
jgi:hypothetical protein